jgi:sigma-B regulation protein RsbQ
MATSILRKLNVHLVGSGGPAVALGHGFGTDQRAWRHQVAALAPRHQVVLFDYLGCGGSEPGGYTPLRYDSLERYADDLLELHLALGLRWKAFVGHSASGMIGLLACLARPDLAERLILLGASPRYLNDGDYVGGFERADLDAFYDAMGRDYLGWANGFAPLAMANRDRPALGEAFARSLGAMRPDIAQSVARAIFESDFRSRLGQLEVPALVLQSRRDIAVPMEVGEYLARHLPRSRLVVLEAEGHFPQLSAPEQVTAAILQGLGDVA